jgi:hypothetical protein
MSIDDERELRQRLDAALETITPRPAPVGAVLRQGRTVRTRRRVLAGACVAAAVVVGLSVPALLHRQAAAPSPAPLVTVVPPGPHSPAGLVASGVVGSRHWRVIADKPSRGSMCFEAGSLYCGEPARAIGPVSFGSGGSGDLQAHFGPVRRDVTRVDVSLADGAVLVLHPVRLYGGKYVAFATPLHMRIVAATAYSARSELARAAAFNGAGTAIFGMWLRPGQAGLAQVTYQIGSGLTDGRAWSVFEHAGPWGRCFTSDDHEVDCADTAGSMVSPGQVTTLFMEPGPDGGAGLYAAVATEQVTAVRLTLSDGRVISPRVVPAGGQKAYAFGVPSGLRVLRWTAYGAGGQRLGSGNGAGG